MSRKIGQTRVQLRNVRGNREIGDGYISVSPDGRYTRHLHDLVSILRNHCFRRVARVVLVLVHIVRTEGLLWRRGSTGFPWRGLTTSS